MSRIEQRGPAPSVSTALLFLVGLTVVAAFSVVSVLVDPSDSPLRPWLAALIPLPTLGAWWLWARRRNDPQPLPMIVLALLAGQFFAGLARIVLFDDASRTAFTLAWLALVTTGLALVGGLIYLWFQRRKAQQQ